MERELLSMGIDTNNYKTSLAVVDKTGEVLFNYQEFLDVKPGEKGLRQSEAFFQHVQKLPEAIEKAFEYADIRENIGAIAVSSRPRPVEGSYMPVFTAGHGYARALAASMGISLQTFSHQEGHIEAIRHYSSLKDEVPLICFHFSGGTTEALLLDENGKLEIVGGSKDIAYGQVLDRVGVSLGYAFPCGRELDEIAVSASGHREILSKIKVKDGYVNLSGIETQCQRVIEDYPQEELIDALFERLCESVADMTTQLAHKYDINNFIYAGGVSCSTFMRNYLSEHMYKDVNIVFGKPEMSADNAIGTALLGGKNIWL